MFRLQIQSVVNWELEFLPALFQQFDSFSISDPLEWAVHDEIKSSKQFLVHELAEKFHLVRAMCARVRDQIFNKLLGEIHVAFQIAKRHFRFDHPKLACVPRRVRVLSTKSGSKGINVAQRQRESLGFELAAYCQVSWPGEKIFRVIDFTLRGSRSGSSRIQRCDAKQFSSSLAVAAGNDWRMHINETPVLKKLVNGKGKPASHAKDTAEKI